jgi:hypothetical protein
VAPVRIRESWAIAVHEALVGMPDVLVGQLIPDGDAYELVLTTGSSPPASELVQALRERLDPLLGREDSPLEGDREAAWRFYPAVADRDREVFARLDWRHAIVLHEWVDG